MDDGVNVPWRYYKFLRVLTLGTALIFFLMMFVLPSLFSSHLFTPLLFGTGALLGLCTVLLVVAIMKESAQRQRTRIVRKRETPPDVIMKRRQLNRLSLLSVWLFWKCLGVLWVILKGFSYPHPVWIFVFCLVAQITPLWLRPSLRFGKLTGILAIVIGTLEAALLAALLVGPDRWAGPNFAPLAFLGVDVVVTICGGVWALRIRSAQSALRPPRA